MKSMTWLKQHRWLLGGAMLACLALGVILTIWAIQTHQYQLTLAHYSATLHQTNQSAGTPSSQTTGSLTPPRHPPLDTSGPGAWGFIGWAARLLALLVPLSLGIFLQWQEKRQRQQALIHKAHLSHATNRLAEAIGKNQELPTGVFDAYSKLRELDP